MFLFIFFLIFFSWFLEILLHEVIILRIISIDISHLALHQVLDKLSWILSVSIQNWADLIINIFTELKEFMWKFACYHFYNMHETIENIVQG